MVQGGGGVFKNLTQSSVKIMAMILAATLLMTVKSCSVITGMFMYFIMYNIFIFTSLNANSNK